MMYWNIKPIKTEVIKTKPTPQIAVSYGYCCYKKKINPPPRHKHVLASKLNSKSWLCPPGIGTQWQSGEWWRCGGEKEGIRKGEQDERESAGTQMQLLLQENLWHHALQKFFSPVTWAAAMELKWDPDGEQAWPGLTWHPRGRRVA